MTIPTADGQIVLTLPDDTEILMDMDHETSYNVQAADLMSSPDAHSSPQQNPAGGEVSGVYLDGGRTMTLTVMFTAFRKGHTDQSVDDRLALEAACRPGIAESSLAWQLGGVQRLRYGQPIGLAVNLGKVLYESAILTFRSANPRSYDLTETAYTDTASAAVVNAGTRNSIAWRAVVTGPCVGGQFTYDVIGGNTNTFLLPPIATGYRLELNARRGEARMVKVSDGSWVAVTGQVLDGIGNGFPARFMTIPASATSTFTFTSDSGATTMDVYAQGCWP